MKSLLLISLLVLSIECLGAIAPKGQFGDVLLKTKLKESFPDASRIEVVNFYSQARIPESASILGLHPEVPMGHVQVEFLWREKGETRQGLATAVVSVFSKVLVAHQDMNQNEAFNESNTRLEERELSKLRTSGYFSNLEDLNEVRARGFIAHGTVIGQLQVAKPVLVQAGQLIDLVYKKGGVRISARVRALERGIYNQWIRLENPQSKRILQGRVSDFGQASIQ